MKYVLISSVSPSGLISEEIALEQEGNRIFRCGICSDEGEFVVYHNILGSHNHMDKDQIRRGIVHVEASQ